MKAQDLIELLQQVPGDTEVRILTSDADEFLYEREYTAHVLYSSPDAASPSSFTIGIAYDESMDKTEVSEHANSGHDRSNDIEMGPFALIGRGEPLSTHGCG